MVNQKSTQQYVTPKKWTSTWPLFQGQVFSFANRTNAFSTISLFRHAPPGRLLCVVRCGSQLRQDRIQTFQGITWGTGTFGTIFLVEGDSRLCCQRCVKMSANLCVVFFWGGGKWTNTNVIFEGTFFWVNIQNLYILIGIRE